jgi:hypothetical protein
MPSLFIDNVDTLFKLYVFNIIPEIDNWILSELAAVDLDTINKTNIYTQPYVTYMIDNVLYCDAITVPDTDPIIVPDINTIIVPDNYNLHHINVHFLDHEDDHCVGFESYYEMFKNRG